jgi:hypothetical protein
MFTPHVPSYLIDLDHDETTRWAEVAARDAGVARRLVDEVACEFRLVPEFLRWIFERLYQSSGGLYHAAGPQDIARKGAHLYGHGPSNCSSDRGHFPSPIFATLAACTGSPGYAGQRKMSAGLRRKYGLPLRKNAVCEDGIQDVFPSSGVRVRIFGGVG